MDGFFILGKGFEQTKETPVLMHPKMGACYRKQIGQRSQRPEHRERSIKVMRGLFDSIDATSVQEDS